MWRSRANQLLFCLAVCVGAGLYLLQSGQDRGTPGTPGRALPGSGADRPPARIDGALSRDEESGRGAVTDFPPGSVPAGKPGSPGLAAGASTKGIEHEGPDQWEIQYADVSWKAMLDEARELKDALFAETRSALERRARIGGYEVVATPRPPDAGSARHLGGVPPGAFELGGAEARVRRGLDSLSFTNTEMRKVSLPEWQYPEQHAIHAKAEWLQTTAAERRAHETLGLPVPPSSR